MIYNIAVGNTGGVFAINSASGAITYTGSGEDFESFQTPASAFTLTVTVSDAPTGGTTTNTVATTTVTVAVTDVGGEAPARMVGPTAVANAGSRTSLDVSWTAPANEGPAITDYDVQYRLDSTAPSGSWTELTDLGTVLTTTITGLREHEPYEVQVRATNADGDSLWSASGWGTPGGLTFTSPAAFSVKEHDTAAGRVRVRDLAAQRDLDACRRQGTA